MSAIFIAAIVFAASGLTAQPEPGKQVEQHFVSQANPKLHAGYQLFLPKAYRAGGKKWPLILFLHGSGERGTNLDLVKVHGPPKIVDRKPDFPFIVVSPQCPRGQWWDNKVLTALLDDVIAKYSVNTDQIYLTGLSMGGFGTWSLAAAHPDRFAAIVPICGGGDPKTADKLKTLPIWVFHGEKDRGVPIARSREMVSAIRKAGGNVKFTSYPKLGHNCWTVTYDNPVLYTWLLKQSLAARRKKSGR